MFTLNYQVYLYPPYSFIYLKLYTHEYLSVCFRNFSFPHVNTRRESLFTKNILVVNIGNEKDYTSLKY